MKKLAAAFLFLVILALGAGLALYQDELQTPFPEGTVNQIIEIPRGSGVREVVGLLEDRKAIHNRYVVMAYLIQSGLRHRLQAGEYQFDRPMTPIEVIRKIASGNVLLHKFTVAEGLTLEGTAAKWEEQGYGKSSEFLSAAATLRDSIQDMDPSAPSLEGYLYPETYSFPSKTSARQVVGLMVDRFRSKIAGLVKEIPQNQWPLSLRETVILASLVESEAATDAERPLIASVYFNRIRRGILLQCDPTVIYALEREGRYRGRLLLVDLKFPSFYNTYVNPGLPPGPIMNPGLPSLKAAVQPPTTPYLFFVRTIDGRHKFSATLAEHNRAVAEYRALQRQRSK
jgi:UPF0755 protein